MGVCARRGFLEGCDDLTFVTDRRSSKVAEAAANPAAEVAWYFPNSREQYRIAGRLTIVDEGFSDARLLRARQAAWSRMSAAGRQQFVWPHPGLPRIPDKVGAAVRRPQGMGLAPGGACVLLPWQGTRGRFGQPGGGRASALQAAPPQPPPPCTMRARLPACLRPCRRRSS